MVPVNRIGLVAFYMMLASRCYYCKPMRFMDSINEVKDSDYYYDDDCHSINFRIDSPKDFQVHIVANCIDSVFTMEVYNEELADKLSDSEFNTMLNKLNQEYATHPDKYKYFSYGIYNTVLIVQFELNLSRLIYLPDSEWSDCTEKEAILQIQHLADMAIELYKKVSSL